MRQRSSRQTDGQVLQRTNDTFSQARYWLLTIPAHAFTPYLPPTCDYIRGQLESGHEGGYLHWQVIAYFSRKVRIGGVRRTFGPYHAEPTRFESVEDYVWKEDTRVAGTQFELGQRAFHRNSRHDWDEILSLARSGDFTNIPAQVQILHWRNLCAIRSEYLVPVAAPRTAVVYWGPTGTGKSYRAWQEAGMDAYAKIPSTKFFCGYRGQEHVVVDEFRGRVDIDQILRWVDGYPIILEIKGSTSYPCRIRKFWFTSNLNPVDWYPDKDPESVAALLRRLEIVHVPLRLY